MYSRYVSEFYIKFHPLPKYNFVNKKKPMDQIQLRINFEFVNFQALCPQKHAQ